MEIDATKTSVSAVLGALLVTGAFEQVAQVLLVREFFVVFKGNEVSFGAVFAFWMLWTAAGSWAAGFFARKIKRPVIHFCVFNILLASCLIAEIYLVRISRGFFAVPSGAYISIFSMAFFTFVLLAGVCLIGGAQFVIGARIYAGMRKYSGAEVPARTYIADSLGCLAGGLAVTFVFVTFFDSFTSAFVSAACLLAGTAWLAFSSGMRVPGAVAGIATAACMALTFFGSSLSGKADKSQWSAYNKSYELVETRNSRYGNIAILKYMDQHSLFINGELYFSMPDETAPVISANLFMLQHPAPKNILVIGGGLSGLLRGILRYNVEHVDYVELDPQVIDITKKYLEPSDLAALKNPVVHIHNIDGRLFVSQKERMYDLVICQLPDPSTASINRFYTAEFFSQIRKILRTGGVFITGVSSEGFWEKELLRRNTSVFATLCKAFPEVIASPGGSFIAGEKNPSTTLDADELVRRFNAHGLCMKDFVPEIFYTKLEPDSVRAVNEKLSRAVAFTSESEPLINTDSFPVSYYYNLIIWNRYSETKWIEAFDWMVAVRTWWVLPVLAVLLLPVVILGLFPRTRKRDLHAKYSVLFLMAISGLFGMFVEIALLYWFQNIYGYVYSMLGLLTALFMTGLAAGALILRFLARRLAINRLVMVIGIGALVFCGVVAMLNTVSLPYAFLLYLFLVSNLFGGLLVGAMFALMTFAAETFGWRPESSAGLLYGADLAGACVGALTAGSLLIPVLGMRAACLVVGLLLVGALGGYIISMQKS
ncbi:MAG: fused MFS/spermidine synthase [Desulfobacteraceae bacterium]|nr:fused MFS/spermidine synthase [Desulfobacteraceae bacterium]MBC2756141.1 fused MFS/spermidine synthase [Desulfobacteraceae bacterium]